MNYIKRQLQDIVLQLSQEYPVVLITGPRQVGKTTMLTRVNEDRITATGICYFG